MAKKNVIIIIIAVVLLLSVILCIGISKNTSTDPYEKQLALGYKYLKEGNYDEAVLAFTKAIGIDSARVEGYIGRAEAYVGSEETEKTLSAALSDYEKVLQLDDKCVDGYLGIADIYIRMGEYDKALEILNTGLEKTGNDKRISDKISEIKSGNIKDSAGKVRKSTTYDTSGKITGYRLFSYEGSVTKSSYYDENNNLTAYDIATKNDRGLSERYEYYDADGTLKTCRVYDYEFDDKNRISKVIDYDDSGNMLGYSTKEYDSKGNQIKSSNFDSNGNLEEYFVYDYSGGKNTKLHAYDAGGKLLYTTVNE